jgi:hypothetical protein
MPKLSIVIDTSVARASGRPESKAPLGQQCRDVLIDILDLKQAYPPAV